MAQRVAAGFRTHALSADVLRLCRSHSIFRSIVPVRRLSHSASHDKGSDAAAGGVSSDDDEGAPERLSIRRCAVAVVLLMATRWVLAFQARRDGGIRTCSRES